jgi:hypothetical protein
MGIEGGMALLLGRPEGNDPPASAMSRQCSATELRTHIRGWPEGSHRLIYPDPCPAELGSIHFLVGAVGIEPTTLGV